MKDKLILKNRLREYRVKQGNYTQQALADAVGCTRQTIIALENNKYNPSLILSLMIAEKLSVSVNEIFKLENKENDDD